MGTQSKENKGKRGGQRSTQNVNSKGQLKRYRKVASLMEQKEKTEWEKTKTAKKLNMSTFSTRL